MLLGCIPILDLPYGAPMVGCEQCALQNGSTEIVFFTDPDFMEWSLRSFALRC
jgi:hypothetical protein